MSLVEKERQNIIKRLPLSKALETYRYNTDYERISCPFHDESTPSMFWDDDKQVFHCFGCGAKGTVVEFIKQKESERNNNLELKDLLRYIGKVYNIEVGDLDGEVIARPVSKRVQRVTVNRHTRQVRTIQQYEQKVKQGTPEIKTIGYYLIDRWGWGETTFDNTVKQLDELLGDTKT